MIHKGIIKAYNPSTHTANVQLMGSLAVWLNDIPVSRGIALGQIFVGSPCAVIFLDPNNPADAMVVSVSSTGIANIPTWEHIETIQLPGDATTIDFQNISTFYNAFRLTAYIKRHIFGDPLSVALRFNADAGNNYDWVDLMGNGIVALSNCALGQSYAVLGTYDDTSYGIAFAYIQNLYTSVPKECMVFAGIGGLTIRNIANRWNNTNSKITRITLDALILNLHAGSWATLEGCRQPV